jgi:hypothetical protein
MIKRVAAVAVCFDQVATQRLASDKGDLEVGLGKFRIA